MSQRWQPLLTALLAILLLVGGVSAATYSTEHEPNNTPAQANALYSGSPMQGTIDPAGDVDYFSTKGYGIGWGIVALLDASASTTGHDAVLTAYAPDGTTVRAQNTGRWQKGPLIAWLRDTGRDDHFLRVSEQGGDGRITPYTLRYYALPLGEQPEQEPNDTPATANTSAITNIGVIGAPAGADCFAFSGKARQKVMVALNADPEDDGGPADFILDLRRRDGSVWASADYGGPGEDEFIDERTLPDDGVYAYCIRAKSGAGPDATYLAGIILDGKYYLPPMTYQVDWTNPRPGGWARVGDEMRYTVTLTYGSPLPFPGPFTVNVYYDPDCQSIVDDAHADFHYSGRFGWQFDEVTPNMAVSKSIVLRAKSACVDTLDLGYGSDYYVTGTRSSGAHYIIGYGGYMPLVLK